MIHVPGLGERTADVPFLVRELLARRLDATPAAVARFLDDGVPRTDPVLVDVLLRREYTHHMRELERLLGISIATSSEDYLAATPEFFAALRDGQEDEEEDDTASARSAADIPPDHVVAALRETGGNVTRAAARLGITRYALRRLMRKHGVGGSE